MYFVPQPHLDYERQSRLDNKLHLSQENIQVMLNNIQTKKLESYDCAFHFFVCLQRRLVWTIFNVSTSNFITLINMIFPYLFACSQIIIQRIKINFLKLCLRDMVIFRNLNIGIFLELGNEYFLELEHPHFLELEQQHQLLAIPR